MKILVTGYTGQLGHDVVKFGLDKNFKVIGVGSSQLDITVREDVFNFVHDCRPDVIIHCAAYTAVDRAEDEKENAELVNITGTRNLAQAAHSVQAKFMYISTDYVFDGEGDKPFKETDHPNPQSYYGLTKLKGEKIVQSELKKWFIIRISWVFGINGNNFVKTMLKLSQENKDLNIVGDQYGSPTYTYDLAKLLIEIIQTEKYGIYHASNEGYCSWAEFAQEIFFKTGAKVNINIVSTEEYPTRATRPKNSRFSKTKLDENGFKKLPTWQDALDRYLIEMKMKGEEYD